MHHYMDDMHPHMHGGMFHHTGGGMHRPMHEGPHHHMGDGGIGRGYSGGFRAPSGGSFPERDSSDEHKF